MFVYIYIHTPTVHTHVHTYRVKLQEKFKEMDFYRMYGVLIWLYRNRDLPEMSRDYFI